MRVLALAAPSRLPIKGGDYSSTAQHSWSTDHYYAQRCRDCAAVVQSTCARAAIAGSQCSWSLLAQRNTTAALARVVLRSTSHDARWLNSHAHSGRAKNRAAAPGKHVRMVKPCMVQQVQQDEWCEGSFRPGENKAGGAWLGALEGADSACVWVCAVCCSSRLRVVARSAS